MKSGRLAGKVAVVTGGTSGIGAAVCRSFVSQGARVVLVARREDAGHRIVAELGADWSTFVQGDVADEMTADSAMAAARVFGGIGVLVNNAGVDHTSDLLDADVRDVRRVLEINFIGAFLMLRAAAREMIGTGGTIINVVSRTAIVGIPTMAIYGASKGALLSLSRAAAVELGGRGIRVNAVAPGLTDTPLARAWMESQPDASAFARQVLQGIPMGKLTQPEDVAAAIVYLASDEASSVTGACIAIDGGYTAA